MRVLGDCFEVAFAALDFRRFEVAQIVPPCAAFRFHDEVELFLGIVLHHHGPVGVVCAQGCGDFEPWGQFGVDFYAFVFFQVFGE